MGGSRILIVDDELIMRESLSAWLERDGHHLKTAAGGEEALSLTEKSHFDIILLDIKMAGISGIDVLKAVREKDQDVAIVMITAYGSVNTAVEAMKYGATDYLMKPFDPDELGLLIEKIERHQQQARENQYLRQEYQERTRFESMVGQSKAMQKVFNLIEDVAPMDSTVLIRGETGTGKGLAAKAIHTHSTRATGPFVAVNCGAFPEQLLESELFGYQKGAFTDAVATKKGRFELAHNGTLFLDEIGEISMRMQIDLLRILEDRVFYRLGSTQPVEVDFRVIAATNRDLEAAIKDKTFREDLYYRLNVFTFTMPSLRERKEDIPLLADHFLRRFAMETNKPLDRISRDAIDEMMVYEWPGNIRELENAVERAVVVAKGPVIFPDHLPIMGRDRDLRPMDRSLKELEKTHIAQILEQHDWNISRCSEILKIDRSTLYSKMKRYGIRKAT